MLRNINDEVAELLLQFTDEQSCEEPIPNLLEAEEVDVRKLTAHGALQLSLNHLFLLSIRIPGKG
jgi:hypothetical protein